MQLSRSTKVLVLSSGQALTAVVGLASAAALVRIFSKVDYAAYRQTLLCYTLALPFVTLGFDRALNFFLPAETRRPRGVLVENLILLTAAGGALSLFLLAGGNRLLATRFNNPPLGTLLLVLSPIPLFALPALALPACLIARNRAEQVAAYQVGSRIVLFSAIVLPCLIWPTPFTAIVGTVASAAITTSVAVVLMFRACREGDWRPTWQGLREQFRFSAPLGLSGLVGAIGTRLDQVLVSLRSSPEIYALYSVGSIELPLIGIITGSIASVVVVDYARLYRERRMAEIVDLIHRVMLRSSLILMPAMFFFLCAAPDFVTVMFGREYAASAAVFRIYLLLLPMRTLSYGATLQALGQSRHIFYQTLVALVVNAFVGWFAVGYFGAVGAAFVLVADTYITYIPYNLVVLRNALACPIRHLFPWRGLAAVIAASALGAFPVLALNALAPGWPAIVRLITDVAIYGLVTLAAFSKAGWTSGMNPFREVAALAGFVRDGSGRPTGASPDVAVASQLGPS